MTGQDLDTRRSPGSLPSRGMPTSARARSCPACPGARSGDGAGRAVGASRAVDVRPAAGWHSLARITRALNDAASPCRRQLTQDRTHIASAGPVS
jgi:hypothetical protein